MEEAALLDGVELNPEKYRIARNFHWCKISYKWMKTCKKKIS